MLLDTNIDDMEVEGAEDAAEIQERHPILDEMEGAVFSDDRNMLGQGELADFAADLYGNDNNELPVQQEAAEEDIHDIPRTLPGPITPPQKAHVIVYIPSKTWTPAYIQNPFMPSTPATPLSVPENAILTDEESEPKVTSPFKMLKREPSASGSEASDYNPVTNRRKSVSRILSPPRGRPRTRAQSIGSFFHIPVHEELEYDPVTNPRRRFDEAKTPSRDKNGKFTRKAADGDDRIGSPRSRALSVGCLPVEGIRFGSITHPRQKNHKPRTPARDKNGKFASNNSSSAGQKRKRGSSVLARSLNANHSFTETPSKAQRQDPNGRFAYDGTTSAYPHVQAPVDLLNGEDPLPYVLATMAEVAKELEETAILIESNRASSLQPTEEPMPAKPIRAKRAPAKSPYFALSPPVTPSKKGKGKSKVKAELVSTPDRLLSHSTEPRTPSPDGQPSSQPTPKKPRTPSGIVSCIPFPPLSSPHFGLIQEKLAHDPFRLLIAVTFLIRTHGKHAIPVFYELISKYPTPESLVAANKEDIVHIIRHLGLQNQRAATYQTYAKIWLEDPPLRDKRYAIKGYPEPNDGRDVKKDEILTDSDERVGWEIGHMTSGPYALDSWRIFCRDRLRGVAEGWNGEGNYEEGFQPEWMRVVPEDKELRAFLRWMWLKEGFEWDPFTGEKEVAGEVLMKAAMGGRIAWDDRGGMRILGDDELAL